MPLICQAGESQRTAEPGALHKLRATPETVHWGYFDADLAPVLKAKSGDLIQAEAINDAYSLMSVAADFGVTQVVDGRQGMHVRIPRTIFGREGE